MTNHKLVAICLLTLFVLSLGAPFAGFMLKIEAVEAETTYYSTNAVWIMNAAWGGFPSDKKNILTWHLDDVVADLRDSNITYVFVFVGYWNSSDSTIGYTMTDSQITTVINAFHSINCTVLAWAEDNGAIDVTPENRSKLYTEITNCMKKGFDGYNDDIESYVGTHQNWIDYLNNATVVLHNLGKLMTADVGFDWQQNTNPYLHMDYIITMFYSDRSACEDPKGRWFWQENFGQYRGNNNPPASPIILGVMNYYGNAHPLTWQLNWIDNQLSSGDGHPQLVGFCIWLYEYMSDSDWRTWKHWITGPHPPPANTPTPTSEPNPSEIIYPVAAVIGISAIVVIALVIRRKYGKCSQNCS
jgi:hypothetical protein